MSLSCKVWVQIKSSYRRPLRVCSAGVVCGVLVCFIVFCTAGQSSVTSCQPGLQKLASKHIVHVPMAMCSPHDTPTGLLLRLDCLHVVKSSTTMHHCVSQHTSQSLVLNGTSCKAVLEELINKLVPFMTACCTHAKD